MQRWPSALCDCVRRRRPCMVIVPQSTVIVQLILFFFGAGGHGYELHKIDILSNPAAMTGATSPYRLCGTVDNCTTKKKKTTILAVLCNILCADVDSKSAQCPQLTTCCVYAAIRQISACMDSPPRQLDDIAPRPPCATRPWPLVGASHPMRIYTPQPHRRAARNDTKVDILWQLAARDCTKSNFCSIRSPPRRGGGARAAAGRYGPPRLVWWYRVALSPPPYATRPRRRGWCVRPPR